MNLALNADAPIEANQVCAATKQNMLAIIDDFIHAGMQIRRGTPAKISAPFDKLHAKSSLGQRTCRAHACHTAANDGDCARCFSLIVKSCCQPHLE